MNCGALVGGGGADDRTFETPFELAEAQVILLAQADPDEEHFTAGLLVNRAVRNGGKLIYVHPEGNRLTGLAEVHVRCSPGTEAEVALAIARLASGHPEDLDTLHDRTAADEEAVRAAAALFEGWHFTGFSKAQEARCIRVARWTWLDRIIEVLGVPNDDL